MDSGISFAEIAKEFHEESIDLLSAMEMALVSIRENGMDDEAVNAVFRAAHTIKGTAGMYKIDYLVEFTHVAENLLDRVRNGGMEMNDELGELLLECKDHMQNLVEFAIATDNTGELSEELTEVSDRLLDALGESLGEKREQGRAPAADAQGSAESGTKTWVMDIRFGPQVMEQGFEPSSFLAYLKGNCEHFDARVDIMPVPGIEMIDPTTCYLRFDIRFTTAFSEAEIRDVFEFVEEECTIVLKEEVTETAAAGAKEPEIAVPAQADPVQKAAPALSNPAKAPAAKHGIGKSAAAASSLAPQNNYSIRVDAEKIDHLINLIGEMVISNANVVQQSIDLQNSELIESVSIVSRMLEDIRENAMQIRMVQIGETFNRFKRIVMDLSKKLGKEIELVIKGGETELDKTVIEKITDPLVHIVRNAIDHGIEAPADRGDKKEKGTLLLNAYHDAGTVVIEITDDGKGLNEELIHRKAAEKGLIEEGEQLSPEQIYKLILEPGFSTAAAITDVSGRGVGMDVVKRNIEALRGNIEIKSKKGEGTSFIIRLPLTLAIIDGFLVKVGETSYVIPLDMVVECIELSEREKEEMHGNNYIDLRGTILPLLNVGEFFGEEKGEESRSNIVVVHYAGRRYGFIVDELFGEFQTVIKPLGKIFSQLKGISGATILGSGNVALILDIPMLVSFILTLRPKSEAKEY